MKGDPFGSEPELGQRSKYQQEKHVIHSRLWSLPITPGSIVVPHTHSREDEVTYVIEGEIGVKIGDQVVTAPSGSYVFKPKNVRHTFWNPGTRDARTLEMIAPPDFASYFEELSKILSEPGSSAKRKESELDEKHGLTNQPEWLPELVREYKLKKPLS